MLWAMKGESEANIKKKIEVFLTPKKTKAHGRPIYRDEAADCGLKIEKVDIKSPMWQNIYELFFRTDNFVSSNNVGKCIETEKHSLFARVRS
jgi:ssDNA-binding Zn-finger/Zn-ribbon topoisomerase 1